VEISSGCAVEACVCVCERREWRCGCVGEEGCVLMWERRSWIADIRAREGGNIYRTIPTSSWHFELYTLKAVSGWSMESKSQIQIPPFVSLGKCFLYPSSPWGPALESTLSMYPQGFLSCVCSVHVRKKWVSRGHNMNWECQTKAKWATKLPTYIPMCEALLIDLQLHQQHTGWVWKKWRWRHERAHVSAQAMGVALRHCLQTDYEVYSCYSWYTHSRYCSSTDYCKLIQIQSPTSRAIKNVGKIEWAECSEF